MVHSFRLMQSHVKRSIQTKPIQEPNTDVLFACLLERRPYLPSSSTMLSTNVRMFPMEKARAVNAGISFTRKFQHSQVPHALVRNKIACAAVVAGLFLLLTLCLCNAAVPDELRTQAIIRVGDGDIPCSAGDCGPFASTNAPHVPKAVLPEWFNAWLSNSFLHAVTGAFVVIIVTELGDKTFFIAAIMSMQHPRLHVFAGAILALILMTILSSLLGFAATAIPHELTHYIASALFVLFGLKMLYDAWKMKPAKVQAEYEETVTLLQEQQAQLERAFEPSPQKQDDKEASYSADDDESIGSAEAASASGEPRTVIKSLKPDAARKSPKYELPWKLRVLRVCPHFCSLAFLQALMLTFLAEWGDRSQLSTIVLVARGENFWGVSLGACVGHSLCTGLACIGGSLIGKRISPRYVLLIGGILFLAFAIYGFVAGP